MPEGPSMIIQRFFVEFVVCYGIILQRGKDYRYFTGR